jgi:ABC-type multidrug transport system fused ATPase/permease subunit
MQTQSLDIGKKSAARVLKGIVRRYPGRLTLTGSLVVGENALDLFYPVAAGIAIDAVLSSDLERAFLMVGVIFGFWLLGAIRKAVDTRVYTKIYADLARSVVLTERRALMGTSTTIAHAALTRQFVDFFELQVPAFVTAAVSIVGSLVMLVILAPDVGAVAAGMLLIALIAALRYMKLSEFIATCLHNRQEHEAREVTSGSPGRLARHFRVLAGRRVQLSDLEAGAYVGVGLIASILFATLFWSMAQFDAATAGLLYTLVSYVWTFVFSLDDLPVQLQQLSRVKELGQRISPDDDTTMPAGTAPHGGVS